MHGFDVVPVEIAEEDPVVGRVVLGPHAGRVKDLRFRLGCCPMHGIDRGAVRRAERDMHFPSRRSGTGSEPEVGEPSGPASPTTGPSSRVYRIASRNPSGENLQVEGRCGVDVVDLQREVIEHESSVSAVTPAAC
jgi:hypothetical protein